MNKLKTAEEAKNEIKKNGMTIAKWSMSNGLPPSVVYAVLKGDLQGNYGNSHKAAVLLGMKHGEIVDSEQQLRRA